MKRVLVTGGSKGIGRAIVLEFASNGFEVIACARGEESLEELREEVNRMGGAIKVATCDVRKPSEIKSFVEKNIHGYLDVMVNNAGIFIPGQIHQEEDNAFEQMMETNLNSTYYFSKAVIPLMINQPKAHIFNICSTASITAYPNGGSYCISKYAQYGLTKVLREELKPKSIKVTAVLPGATYTNSWYGTDLPESRFMDPKTIGEMVYNCYNMPVSAVVEELLIRPMLGDIT